jgi:hypothetical protein
MMISTNVSPVSTWAYVPEIKEAQAYLLGLVPHSLPVWCKYSVRPERTKDYSINPKTIPKKFDG